MTNTPGQHVWSEWKFSDGLTLTCCNLCGIVRRADDKNKPCRGKVKVELRASDILRQVNDHAF